MKRMLELLALTLSFCLSMPESAKAADALPDGVISISPMAKFFRFTVWIPIFAFIVPVSGGAFLAEAKAEEPQTLFAQVFTPAGDGGGGITGITFQTTSGGTAFTDENGTTTTFSVRVQENGVDVADGTTVTWNVQSSDISRNSAVATDTDRSFNGLTLGGTSVTGATTTVSSTTNNGIASIALTDILGERDVTVQAQVAFGGVNKAETSPSFTFGKGPLSNFALGYPANPEKKVIWSDAINTCGGSRPGIFPKTATYYPDTNLPGVNDTGNSTLTLQAISGNSYLAMRSAAGLPSGYFWTGRAQFHGNVGYGIAWMVFLEDDSSGWGYADGRYQVRHRVLCVRP